MTKYLPRQEMTEMLDRFKDYLKTELGNDVEVSTNWEMQGSKQAEVKIIFKTIEDDGNAYDLEKAKFASKVVMHPFLRPDDYGLEFFGHEIPYMMSGTFKIVDYKTRNHKYPLIVEKVYDRNKKRYKLGVTPEVRALIEKKRQARDQRAEREQIEKASGSLASRISEGAIYS